MKNFMLRILAGLCLAAWAVAPCQAGEKLVASLEYSGADRLDIYLNGQLIKKGADTTFFYYSLLSSSDGSLPLAFLRPGVENVLTFVSSPNDTRLTYAYVAARLRISSSEGNLAKVFLKSENTKFLVLQEGQTFPAGCLEAGFDASAWTQAKGYYFELAPRLRDMDAPVFPEAPLAHLVPFLSTDIRQRAGSLTRVLFRCSFILPNVFSKARILFNPAKISPGQKLSCRIVPNPVCLDSGRNFQLWMQLPQGLHFLKAVDSGLYSNGSNQLLWSYSAAASGMGLAKASLQEVQDASSWKLPRRALGPFKPDHDNNRSSLNQKTYEDGARFLPGTKGWFSMGALQAPPGQEAAQIEGVVFHSQLFRIRSTFKGESELVPILFNYSVDDSNHGILPEDHPFTPTGEAAGWSDGYYDASLDRDWTWADLSKLRVSFAAGEGFHSTTTLSSCEVTVRYRMPPHAAPAFIISVAKDVDKDLELKYQVQTQGFRVDQGQDLESSPLPWN